MSKVSQEALAAALAAFRLDVAPLHAMKAALEAAFAAQPSPAPELDPDRLELEKHRTDGWDSETVGNVLSTLRYVLGVKSKGGTPNEQLQQMIGEVASWGRLGPCHPHHDQKVEAAGARAAYVAAATQPVAQAGQVPHALYSAFMTSLTGNGRYEINLKFDQLADAQVSHDYLLKLIAAAPQHSDK